MKKTLAVGIVLLFIGVAFAPSLFADVETDNSTGNSDIEITDISYGIWMVISTIKNNGLTDAEIDVQFIYIQFLPAGLVTYPIGLGPHHVTIPAGDIIKVTQFFGGLGRFRFSVVADGESLSSNVFWLFFFGIKLN